MPMIARIACLLPALLAVALLPAPAPASTCRPPASAGEVVRGSRTVVWSRQDAVISCHRRTGRRFELLGWTEDAGYDFATHRLATNGNLAGVVGHYTDKYGGSYVDMVVADVRRRRTKSIARLFPSREDVMAGRPAVTGFVLAPTGTVALTYAWAHPPRVEAFAPRSDYRPGVVLDDAADASGLRLVSRTAVAWLDGGEERTAELPR